MPEKSATFISKKRLEQLKSYQHLTPSNAEELFYFISDHLLPVVRAAAVKHDVSCRARHLEGPCTCGKDEAQRILSEGGY